MSEENICQQGGFSRKDSPFSRKDSPYSKQTICPVILQENGWPLWTETKEKLRLEKYK